MNKQHKRPDYNRARKKALSLLQKFNYVNPPVNPVAIARHLGIEVAFVSFPNNPNVAGFYDPSDNRIYVNANEPPKRQTFTIAHELGHACLHKEWAASNEYEVLMRDAGSKGDPIEQEANAFAAHLLVPRSMLARFWDKMPLPELSDMFAVSTATLSFRIGHEFNEPSF